MTAYTKDSFHFLKSRRTKTWNKECKLLMSRQTQNQLIYHYMRILSISVHVQPPRNNCT